MADFTKLKLFADVMDGEEFDFIICGGGSAGAALASRLTEDLDVKVLLIEAGSSGKWPTTHIPASCGDIQSTDLIWNDFSEPDNDSSMKGLIDQRGSLPRGKMLGGGSAVNYMAYVRGHPEDFNEWERMGAEGWGYENLLPLFKKMEGCTIPSEADCVVDQELHGWDGPLTTTVRTPVVPIAKDFVKGSSELGYPEVDYNGQKMEGVSLFQSTVRNGMRCSTSMAYLDPALGRANLHVLIYTTVCRVVLDKKRCVGVEIAFQEGGKRKFLRAKKEVVLSAGAYGTPQVLQLSGIGKKAELEKHKIECLHELDQVGANLEDHLFVPMMFRNKKGDNLKSLTPTMARFPNVLTHLRDWMGGKGALCASAYDGTLFTRTGLNPDMPYPDMQIGVNAGIPDSVLWGTNLQIDHTAQFENCQPTDQGCIMVPTLLHPHSKGTVKLRGANPFSLPVIRNNYLGEDLDKKVMAWGCKEAFRICTSSPAMKKLNLEYDPPKVLVDKYGPDWKTKDDFWMDLGQYFGHTLYHPTSTCKIGQVCDPKLKVYGIDGLRIADASVMPHVISGNTNAPSIMIGEKAAEILIQEYELCPLRSLAKETRDWEEQGMGSAALGFAVRLPGYAFRFLRSKL